MNTTDVSLDEIIELALRKADELAQEAHVLNSTRPYDYLAFKSRAENRAADYRQFVRTAEELKKLL